MSPVIPAELDRTILAVACSPYVLSTGRKGKHRVAPKDDPPPAPGCPIETIAQAYLQVAEGNEGQALRCAITDALSDLMATDMRVRGTSRLISRGYVRGALNDAAEKA